MDITHRLMTFVAQTTNCGFNEIAMFAAGVGFGLDVADQNPAMAADVIKALHEEGLPPVCPELSRDFYVDMGFEEA